MELEEERLGDGRMVSMRGRSLASSSSSSSSVSAVFKCTHEKHSNDAKNAAETLSPNQFARSFILSDDVYGVMLELVSMFKLSLLRSGHQTGRKIENGFLYICRQILGCNDNDANNNEVNNNGRCHANYFLINCISGKPVLSP